MRSTLRSAIAVTALTGLGILAASPAKADESAYLKNLYSVGVPSNGYTLDEIYVKLGKLACRAQAAGYDKSEQEQIVAEAARETLQFSGRLSASDFANRIARSARMFLC